MATNININLDWGYVTIMVVYLIATIGYAIHNSSDPWCASMIISVLILAGKAWAWCFGGKR